jgi:tRNA/tmRNA/rRNA uracil-C5-methylase (TrmA/RlmC/RlmD family)
MPIRELKIQDVAFGGNGVARDNGKAVFIPYTIDGEKVSAQITHEKKHFAEAQLREVLQSSADRVTPECPYFGRCGGCSYQHMSYAHQLEIKSRQVEQALKRIGHFDVVPMQPMVASPQPYAYRNRITVHCEDGVIGFYRRDEHRLIDVERCPISQPEVNDELKNLRAAFPADGHYTLRARSDIRTFSQTNDAVAERLRAHVRDLISNHGPLLIDAYCGAGFFAKALIDKFDSVIGIDWDRFAIAQAKQNAAKKELYVAGDVDTELQTRGGEVPRRSATVIVDPPAIGLTSVGRRAINELQPITFIYVSCNPPTLARDLAAFREHFTIESVTPFDMFPQTAEIEVAVKLIAESS